MSELHCSITLQRLKPRPHQATRRLLYALHCVAVFDYSRQCGQGFSLFEA